MTKPTATLFFSSLLCVACAFNLATIKYEPAELIATKNHPDTFTLQEDVVLDKSPCNYDRILRSGTRWETVGRLEQGHVYRSRDQIVTIECSHIYEAYLVVRDETLLGVYLPVEDGYVALKKQYTLTLEK